DPLEQIARAAIPWILEHGVRAPRYVVTVENDARQDAFEIDDRDALTDPLGAHGRRRVCPDLEVVGQHERPGDALAEHPANELLERPKPSDVRSLALRIEQSQHTLQARLRREMMQVLLKGIRKISSAHPDPRVPLELLKLVAHETVEQAVEVGIVREQHVPADVVRKAVRAALGRRETTHVRTRLEDLIVAISELREPIGRAEARRPGADDDELRFGHGAPPPNG